jgi:thiosulfate dehydrogenase
MKNNLHPLLKLITLMLGLLTSIALLTTLMISLVIFSFYGGSLPSLVDDQSAVIENASIIEAYKGVISKDGIWIAPDWNEVEKEPNAEDIKYGRELIANTSAYLGPLGIIKKISNGMNCQNCHLNAGTAPLGNNYGAVASTYPKFRARSGQMEDISKRINDCFERSLNGQPLALDSKEMKAMVAYMEWLGKDVPKGEIPKGTGIHEMALLERGADPIKGKSVYDKHCQSCHMENGEGLKNFDKTGYSYPPVWGDHSYNDGAGLFRMSRFSGFVKTNMPLGATYERPVLTDEEAWDVAAYINSMPRPHKNISKDWPDISKKPIDHPFGPFSDDFSEDQHKFGPFEPIKAAKEKKTS